MGKRRVITSPYAPASDARSAKTRTCSSWGRQGRNAGAWALLLVLLAPVSPAASKTSPQVAAASSQPVVRKTPVKGSSAPKLTIEVLVDAPIEKVARVVGACSDYVGVIPRVQKVILHKRGVPHHVCELFLDMPFPFADVRSTIGYTGSVSADEVVMRYQQVRGDYRVHDGMWRLRAQGRQTHMRYSLHIDLGQPLPKWIINIFTKDALRQTVKEVARRAQAL